MAPQISWPDFEQVDIRTGTIIATEAFPQARKPAYKLTIDFGELGSKRSSAQLTKLYQADELVGKQVVAVVNFPPKQIASFFSECLILGAVANDGTVTLLQTERPTPNGLRIAWCYCSPDSIVLQLKTRWLGLFEIGRASLKIKKCNLAEYEKENDKMVIPDVLADES